MLTDLLAVTTGPDGQATVSYLKDTDQIAAVRITTDAIGSQDIPLVENPSREPSGPVIRIKLGKTSRLSGRIVSKAVQSTVPVAGEEVEVWSQGGSRLPPGRVGFRGGPIRTGADGRFQTPDNLLVGSSYRIVVRAPGHEPIVSEWITIGEQPRTLLPMLFRPLRTITGRVADRRGKPVAGAEVFQSGDGPERTAATSAPDGSFSLGGFRPGPVCLFVRGDGFRFFGRLVKEDESHVAIELTRTGERPAREMRMLPDPIPLEESRDLARRLIEPVWKAAVEQRDRARQRVALRALGAVDPALTLDRDLRDRARWR